MNVWNVFKCRCMKLRKPVHSVYKNLVNFPGVEAFDHLKWTYDEAFEQLFGPGRGAFEQTISKNSNAQGVAWGGGGC